MGVGGRDAAGSWGRMVCRGFCGRVGSVGGLGAGHAGFGDGFDFGDLGGGEGEVVAGVDGVAGDADGGHDDDEVAQGFAVGVAEG